MNDELIQELVKQLDQTKDESEVIWKQLAPLKQKLVFYLLDFYPQAKKWQCRAAIVYYATQYARTDKYAFELGLQACYDKARIVRYRACGLLAYSLNKDAIPHLQILLEHKNPKTVDDAKAAIKAITKRNHNLYIDRDETGHIYWQVEKDKLEGNWLVWVLSKVFWLAGKIV